MIRTVTNDPTRRAKLFTIHPRKLHPRVVILLWARQLCVSPLWIYDVSTLTVNRQSVILSHSRRKLILTRSKFPISNYRYERVVLRFQTRNETKEITKNSTRYVGEISCVCVGNLWNLIEFFENNRARRSMSNVEKCWAAVRGEGVTRIPGAAAHVGLIDSQRRRARVTRHQRCNAACASFRANTKADPRKRNRNSRVILFFSFAIYPGDIAKWISKSSTVRCMDGNGRI